MSDLIRDSRCMEHARLIAFHLEIVRNELLLDHSTVNVMRYNYFREKWMELTGERVAEDPGIDKILRGLL